MPQGIDLQIIDLQIIDLQIIENAKISTNTSKPQCCNVENYRKCVIDWLTDPKNKCQAQ